MRQGFRTSFGSGGKFHACYFDVFEEIRQVRSGQKRTRVGEAKSIERRVFLRQGFNLGDTSFGSREHCDYLSRGMATEVTFSDVV